MNDDVRSTAAGPSGAGPAAAPFGQAVGIGCAVVICGAFAVVGAGLMVHTGTLWWRDRQAGRTWARATCTVLRLTSFAAQGRHASGDEVKVRFRYAVDGRSYESRAADLRDVYGAHSTGDRDYPAFLAGYAEGRGADCYYDPADPARAVLTLDVPTSQYREYLMLGAIFLVGGGWTAQFLWRRRRDLGRPAARPAAPAGKGPTAAGRTLLSKRDLLAAAAASAVAWWVLYTGFGALFGTYVRVVTVYRPAACTILSVGTTATTAPARGRRRGSATRAPLFTFAFTADDGRPYTATGYDGFPGVTDSADKSGVLARWRVGQRYPCWYDPADPTKAVLTRAFDWATLLFVLIGLVPLVLAVGGAVFVPRELWRRWARRRRRRPRPAGPRI